jgi:hypothetical protein
MPNFTLQDFLKVLIPVAAGGVSAYSAPAARAIHGVSGSLMALQEDKRREKELEQEMALRASEGERRGRVLSLQEQQEKGELEDRGSKRKAQQGMFDALGAVLAQLTGEAQAPGAFGGGGPLSPETIDQQTEAREVAPDISLIQSIMAKAGPEGAGAALEYLGRAQTEARGRTEARGKEERTAGRESEQFEKTLGVRKGEAASQAAYWKELGAARTAEAAARKAPEKGGKGTGTKTAEGGVDTDAMAKVNKRIAELTEKGALPGAGGLTPGEMAELKALQLKAAALGGLNTPAEYLSYLGLGPQVGRP